MMDEKKSQFATLSDKVMHHIRHDILCGRLKAGQKLLLNELKERYQVGGSPLREAMVQLSWRNYVVMKPQKGFWVADVSLEELRDILKIRLSVGAIALKDALTWGDEAWELSVLTAYHKLSRLTANISDFDTDLWEVLHKEFHLSLITCQRTTPFIQDLMGYIFDQQERYRHFLISPDFTPEQQYHDNGEHEMLMKASLDRDFDLASKLLHQHTYRLYQLLEKALKAD